MFMSRLLATIALVLFFIATPAFSDSNPTAQGRWSLGGDVSFPFVYDKYRNSTFGYSIRPEANYFVFDGFELSFGVTLSNRLSIDVTDLPQLSSSTSNIYWGIKLGAAYYVPVSQNVQPYIGLDVGTLMANWEFKQLLWYFEVPIGVAWFLNPNVAFTFGFPISVTFSSTAIFEKVSVNPGFLGLKVLI